MDKHLTNNDIQSLEKRVRTNLINSLSGFKSANLVGTKSKDGKTNLAIISSVFHLGADPALMGMIIRPDVSPRHTLNNIRETNFYTINHVHSDIVKQSHQTSARYPEDVSEFKACNLAEYYVDNFLAPFVSDSKIKIGLKIVDEILIEANGTHLIVGEIEHIIFNDDILLSDGTLEIQKANTVAIRGLDTYFEVSKSARFSYAKPNRDLEEI